MARSGPRRCHGGGLWGGCEIFRRGWQKRRRPRKKWGDDTFRGHHIPGRRHALCQRGHAGPQIVGCRPTSAAIISEPWSCCGGGGGGCCSCSRRCSHGSLVGVAATRWQEGCWATRCEGGGCCRCRCGPPEQRLHSASSNLHLAIIIALLRTLLRTLLCTLLRTLLLLLALLRFVPLALLLRALPSVNLEARRRAQNRGREENLWSLAQLLCLTLLGLRVQSAAVRGDISWSSCHCCNRRCRPRRRRCWEAKARWGLEGRGLRHEVATARRRELQARGWRQERRGGVLRRERREARWWGWKLRSSTWHEMLVLLHIFFHILFTILFHILFHALRQAAFEQGFFVVLAFIQC
mmetsp:Transcript_93815/g.235557  ORF Transcript_93815/g.235557 Transcript_93815/m.235557 type:complete len:351 (+) Transcript_93815:1-1053(+)